MILTKSKRKTMVFARKDSKAAYKLDKHQNWDYLGYSKKLGEKFRSNNSRVSETYFVNKADNTGLDIVDA
jgi:hypothetical protein